MHRKNQVMISEKNLENFSQEFCKTLSSSKDFASPLFDKALIVYVRHPGSINSQMTEYKSQLLQQAK